MNRAKREFIRIQNISRQIILLYFYNFNFYPDCFIVNMKSFGEKLCACRRTPSSSCSSAGTKFFVYIKSLFIPRNNIANVYVICCEPALWNFQRIAYGAGAFDWGEAERGHVVDVADLAAGIYVGY